MFSYIKYALCDRMVPDHMSNSKSMIDDFNKNAAAVTGRFGSALWEKFDLETVNAAIGVLDRLGLPIPENNAQFMVAKEGAVIFSSRYGVVIRIEAKETSGDKKGERINNHPLILQPLGSFDAGETIVEICPGCEVSSEQRRGHKGWDHALQQNLARTGVNYWDHQTNNSGVLPVNLPSFPEGIPVVVDRLAVEALSMATADVKKALAEIGLAGKNPQEELYGSLRQALTAGWEDRAKMKDFWHACSEAVKKGVLVAGWENASDRLEGDAWGGEIAKPLQAAGCARAYDRFLLEKKAVLGDAPRKMGNGVIHELRTPLGKGVA